MRKISLLGLLAALTFGSLAPALAQAPPPVPALPDTERRTAIVLSAQTGPFSVGFAIYGDNTDYQDWIGVWLNGVLQSQTTYTMTSPSGPIASLSRPITDAQITFNSATTGTVQIVGARRPRRVSQFTENRGVSARDLNQTFTDLVASQRETWDLLGRVIQFPPGETQPMLPPAATRANTYPKFAADGTMVVGAAASDVEGGAVAAGVSAAAAAASAATAQAQATLAMTSATNAAASATTASTSAAALTGTSSTSNTVSAASKSFTTQTGKQFAVGVWLLVASNSGPTNYMHGQVTAYNSGTGALTVNVTDVGGSGTLADWNISVSGTQGPAGPQGPTGASGAGSGDVVGPATNTANGIPQWNGANSKTLKDGLPVSTLGTAILNAGTKTAHGIIIGNGTSEPAVTAAATDGQLLFGQTSADPLWKTPSGDVGSAANGALTVQSNAITNAKAAQMGANTIKGNNTGSTANAADLTATQATAVLNAMVGDSGSGGTKGLAPAPSSGDAAAGKFLKADGTYAVPAGGGGGGTTPYTLNGFRLTLSTGVPVMGVAVTGSTSIYLSPVESNQIGLYSGSWSALTSAEFSVPVTNSQSCTSTNGNATLVVADSSQLIAGMKVNGTGIAAATTVSTITDATHVVLSAAATGSGTNTMSFKVPADTGLDLFAKNVSGTPKLFMVKRSSILTPNTLGAQDGVPVLSGDSTMRWVGAVITSATDGQADWALAGQRRFRVMNAVNKRFLNHTEAFAASGTWYRPLGELFVTARVGAPGGGAYYGTGAAGSGGGTTSFGSWCSATGGGPGNTTGGGANGTSGSGSSGDTNWTGGGPLAGVGGGYFINLATFGATDLAATGGTGGACERYVAAASLGATETVTIGAVGTGGGTGGQAQNGGAGGVEIVEAVEF